MAGALEGQSIGFTSGTPPNAAVNSGYPAFTFTAADPSCAEASYTFSATNLPAGLTLTNAGVLTAAGNGPAAGSYNFQVTATDSCNFSAMQPVTIQVSPVAEFYYLTDTPFENNPVTIEAVNGGTTVTCADTVATDPCYSYDSTYDLTLDNNGNFVITSVNLSEGGGTATAVVTLPAAGITVTTPPVVDVSPPSLPTNTVLGPNVPNAANFLSAVVDAGGNFVVLDGGNDAVFFCPSTGALCSLVAANLGYSNFGLPGGNVRIDASGNYVVAVTQGAAFPEIQIYNFAGCNPVTLQCPAVNASPAGLLTGVVNTPAGPPEGDLAGLTIAGGMYYIANEGDGETNAGIQVINPAGPSVSVFYSAPRAFNCPGGITADPQTGNFVVGDCNEGLLAISSDGTAAGVLAAASAWATVIRPQMVTAPVSPPAVTPPPPPLILSSSPLPPGFAQEPYSAGVSASGGTPPYSYCGIGFPAGIGINQFTGAISGATAQAGTFTVSISVTDATGTAASGAFSLTIMPPPPVSLSGASLASDLVGTPLSLVLNAAGGVPPYTYVVTGGALPPGLILLPGGTLHGTPGTAGAYSFTVKVTDSTGGTASAGFSVSILPPPLTITAPSPLATGIATVGYPAQTLSAKGGTAPYTFTVSNGSLPAGLTLSSSGSVTGTPTTATPSAGASFTVMVTDSATPASTGTATLTITVHPFTQNIVLSAGSVSFSLDAGAAALPPSQSVQVAATTVSSPLTYAVAVEPASAAWLSAGGAGPTPGTVSIGLTPAALSLAAATTPYSAGVVVTCMSGACSGNTQTVAVSLIVASPPPQLSVQATTLSFNTLYAAPQATTESLAISNTGGGGIGFESIACGAPWCTVAGVPGSLGAQAGALLSITADPAGLAPGYYYTSVSIVSSAGSASVPVTFSIEPNGVMSLGPAGAAFTLPQGGQLAQGNSFLVDISSPAPVAFSAAVQPGAPWLTVTNGSGTASGTAPGSVSYGFDNSVVAGLAAGSYYGTILVTVGGAANSPLSFEVVLNVTPASTQSVPSLTPGGLIFLTQAVATPPAQTITVLSFAPGATGFQTAASTVSGGNWLSVTPTTGSTSATAPATVNVSVNPAGLNAGVYHGDVNFAFSGTAVRSVNVTLVVENSGAGTTPAISSKGDHSDAAGSCKPSQLAPTSTGLVSNFAAPAAWPVPLQIVLVDDCGNLINNGQIVATFSNGDPPPLLRLGDPASASYLATWTPQHAAAQITIHARAAAPGFAAVTAQLAGAVTPNSAPILADAAIANFFNPIGGAPLAPGALVEITGQYLAAQTMNAPSIPLPLSLGGTSVIIGGMQAPISMVSPGQVNAQVPFELPAGQPYEVIVNANNALTTPQSFQAGAASPGLSVLPNGYLQADHPNGTAVTEAAPAKPGENISIYLAGMGSTTIPVASGQPGPGSPFAATTIDPVIKLNNEAAAVSFSGLIPGLVGVYQVNFAVPPDAPNGDLTLTLAENAFTSNSGLLPVHN